MTNRGGATEAEIALITALALEFYKESAKAAAAEPPPPSWRFSGRWFAAHPYSALRRPGV